MPTLAPVARAWDERGRDVTDLVTRARRHATWPRSSEGAYQGIAQEHFVEFELGEADALGRTGRRWLVAHGWIYPTDSSINVAIGQGGHVTAERPGARGAGRATADGRW